MSGDGFREGIERHRNVFTGRAAKSGAPGNAIRVSLDNGRSVTAQVRGAISAGDRVAVIREGEGYFAVSQGTRNEPLDRQPDPRRNKRDNETQQQPTAAIAYVVAVKKYVPAVQVAAIYSILEETDDPVPFACARYAYGTQANSDGSLMHNGEKVCYPTADPTAPYGTLRECLDAHPRWECPTCPSEPGDGTPATASPRIGCKIENSLGFIVNWDDLPSDGKTYVNYYLSAWRSRSSSGGDNSGGTGQHSCTSPQDFNEAPPRPNRSYIEVQKIVSSRQPPMFSSWANVNQLEFYELCYVEFAGGGIWGMVKSSVSGSVFDASDPNKQWGLGVTPIGGPAWRSDRATGDNIHDAAIPAISPSLDMCSPYYLRPGSLFENVAGFKELECIPMTEILQNGGFL